MFNKKFLSVITLTILLMFSIYIGSYALDYRYTQESGTGFFVGTADKSDALEDCNELRQIINDLGTLLDHSKMDGLYPKDLTTGGTIQIPEAGLKFSNAPANDDIAAYIAGEMTWQTKAELGIDLSLYYLKTEIDTLSEVETIYTKDIIDSDELAALKFTDLADTPANYTDQAGKYVKVNAGETALEFGTPTGGAGTYLELTDTPAAYNNGKYAKSTADGVVWDDPAGGGDALTTDPLSQFAATTSAELAGVISDEVGSGKLIFDSELATNIVLCSNYANPDDAITAIDTANKTLLVTEAETCDVNFTVPANVTVKFERGGKWTINNEITITFNGQIDAGLFEVFTYVGTGVVVFGANAASAVSPEWWGIDGTADEVEIHKARDAAVNVLAIVLQPSYNIDAGLSFSTAYMRIYSAMGLTIITTDDDIDGITISCLVRLENVKINQTGASTKAGLKLTDGAKTGTYINAYASTFKYSLEIVSTTSTGVAYNTFLNFKDDSPGTDSIYIHNSGDGWTNENLFLGGKVKNINIASNCNNNKFIGVDIEGTPQYKFAIVESGINFFTGCRIESNGWGIKINNTTSNWEMLTRISNNYWGLGNRPKIILLGGRANISEGKLSGLLISGDKTSTTVDADSSSGQKDLNVTSEINVYVGDAITIDLGGDREEFHEIASIAAGVLTLKDNLRYTHTGVQADDVIAKGYFYGIDQYRYYTHSTWFVRGKPQLEIKNDGSLNIAGTLGESQTIE